MTEHALPSHPVLRSMMFVPGHNRRLLQSAALSEADALIPDVEDSVQPRSEKQVARDTIREFVESGAFARFQVFPRVNDLESGLLLKDLYALTIPGVAGFVFPKARHGQDIYFIDRLLEGIEREKGMRPGTFTLVPLIETAAAVLNAQDICRASTRVVGIAFGCEDFVSDLQGLHDAEGMSLQTPRALIAMAARATGVIPVDTVHIKVHDLDDLRRNCTTAKALGFEGMLVLHPKEIPVAHEFFTPSVHEVSQAEEMLELAAQAEREGKGVALLNGRFVGPPMVLRAQQVLSRSRAIARRMQS